MKHPYGIGLDIGIASVGWAVVALNENAEPYGLIRCGSRIFDKAEQPKTGDSLAAPRREARSARRRLRRRSLRKADLYELMEKNGLPGKAEIEQAVQAGHLPDVYALRVQALDGPVTALDFARILLHLMQRRGFRSNRKADDAQKDGKLLQAIDANTRRMEANRYRTVGEMMYRDPVFAEHKRNKAENYLSTVKRDQIIDEARLVFAALLTLPSFAGYGHISVKACRKLIPYLEQGMNYNDACQAAGYDFQGRQNGEKAQFLPASTEEMEDITSPVVRRAVAQTIKVVNAIIREQGESPVSIHLELAREMNKNFQQRSELDKAMRDNSAENERLMKELNELFPGRTVTGQDLVKYRLWKEQDGRCAYSIQPLELDKVITVSGYAEVDHIVPYSISFDDRRTNKVLVLASENRQKGNRLPLQYLQGKRRDDFIVYTKANVKNFRKRQNLLKERLSEEDGKGYIQRNLQDTQYIAALMLNYIRNHLAFADCSGAGKRRVVAVNGAVTAFLRKRWGLSKVRADGDLHHAVDAAVIACTTQGMIKRVSDFCKRAETTAVRNEHFPEPWPHFRDELTQRLSACPQEDLMKINPVYYATVDISSIQPVFVSRMPRHKVTGAAHEETIRSQVNEKYTAVRKSITELSLDKDGKIKDYFKPSSDTLLYEALKKRLTEFGGNAKKAFAEPFYKPRADETPGAQVRKVKVVTKMNNTIPVRSGGGVAKGGDMIRIDVYYVPGDGYYWVPIYVADTVKETLPNKAVVRDKTMEEWKEMKEDDFLFSLYSNDLILVERDKPICFSLMHEDSTLPKKYETKKELVYYKYGNISNAAIKVETHNGAYVFEGMTFGTVRKIQKYQVDILGNYVPVKKEKRQTFPAQRR